MVGMLKFRQHIPDHTFTTVPVLAVLFAIHYFLLRDEPAVDGIELTRGAPAYYEHWQWSFEGEELDVDAEIERLQLDDAERDRRIRELLHGGQYRQARTMLLEVAAASVVQNDQQRLADTLLLLGEVAIHQQELAAAEIYLQEALHLAIQQDNLVGTARCYQMLGQLNIRARELARRAANTYDELWQARNMTSRGLYHGVSDNLQRVIEENLEIRRYGAAADAYEALAALYDKLHDNYQARQARIEAARLFASMGQMSQVRRLLDNLDRESMTSAEIDAVEAEIQRQFERYQQDTVMTSQAQDYHMLYHHYLRRGEVERAWQFRIKSSETQARTSDRSVFQRQADIIAVLYSSNFARDRARNYLEKAGAIFSDEGVFEALEQTREMKSLIY